jgi:IS30 family transposase
VIPAHQDQDASRGAAAFPDLGSGHRDAGLENREDRHGIEIYFCDPHSPWQRGINENTDGLLRQYFPQGTDLSIHSAADFDWVAQELNDRPRKRLEFGKPIELIEDLLLQ